MAKGNNTYVPSQFAALPLESLIKAPLTAVIDAQKASSKATADYLTELLGGVQGEGNPPKFPESVRFKLKSNVGATSADVEIEAPLISIVPVPFLRIDSFEFAFTFEVKQAREVQNGFETNLKGSLSGPVAKVLGLSVEAGVGYKRNAKNEESTSGKMEINIKASQSEMPPGLRKIIDAMTDSIKTPTTSSANNV